MHTVSNECHCDTYQACLPNGWMLYPEYVRRHGTFCISSVSCGAFSLILAHSVCDSNDTEHPVSISIVTGMLCTHMVLPCPCVVC